MSLWIFLGLILALVLAALVYPLLRKSTPAPATHDGDVYRDQLAEITRDRDRGLISDDEATALHAEIARRLLKADAEAAGAVNQDTGWRRVVPTVSLLVLVPVASLGIYAYLGSPQLPDQPFASRPQPQNFQARAASNPSEAERMLELGRVVKDLAKRMESEPENINNWLLLGRSYMTLERFRDAVYAFGEAAKRAPGRADIAGSFGEAMFMAAGAKFSAEARNQFSAALAADPADPKSLFYRGLDFARQGKFHDGLQNWVNLMAISPPDAPWLNAVRAQVRSAAEAGNIDIASIKPTLKPRFRENQRQNQRQNQRMGSSAPPGPSREDMEAAGSMSPPQRAQFIRSMVQRLADRLKGNPDDVAGWRRLANAYRVLGETAKANQATAHVKRLEIGGTRQPRGPSREDIEAAKSMTAGDRAQMIRSMVQRLADRLKDNPEDVAGWRRLANAYRVLGEAGKAKQAELEIKRLGGN